MTWRAAYRLVAKHEALRLIAEADLVLLLVDPASPAAGQIGFFDEVVGWTPRYGEAVSEWTAIFTALDEAGFVNPGRAPVELKAWEGRAAEKAPKPKRRMA